VCAITERAVSSKDLPKEARREFDSPDLNALVCNFGYRLNYLVPIFVHAQASAGGEFRLSQSVHWGKAGLAVGRLLVFGGVQKRDDGRSSAPNGGQLRGVFFAKNIFRKRRFRIERIALARIGEESFVTSLAWGTRIGAEFFTTQCGNGRCAVSRTQRGIYQLPGISVGILRFQSRQRKDII